MNILIIEMIILNLEKLLIRQVITYALNANHSAYSLTIFQFIFSVSFLEIVDN